MVSDPILISQFIFQDSEFFTFHCHKTIKTLYFKTLTNLICVRKIINYYLKQKEHDGFSRTNKKQRFSMNFKTKY